MDIRIFKPLDRITCVAEIWEGDRLIGEVFAHQDGERRLFLSKEAVAWGIEWPTFSALVPRVTELLDEADEDMRQARQGDGGA